eukprot:Phypoly_transcript_08178.p1 GENE.Phypoly_transcript_08178~~Phypoly_transcript_08178.p1  ORF type:complete len:467 (+),score=48.79 Phypoly_transcript_08178:83-1483(+)
MLLANFSNAVQYVKDAISPTTTLFVTLSSESYWGGDVVQGTVTVVSMAVPYTAEVRIKLKGSAQGDKSDAVYADDTKYVTKEVHLKEESTIFQGEITESNQIIPFRFTLPEVCPGSFNYEQSGNLGKVYYYAKGSVVVANKKTKRTRQFFEVYEKSTTAVPVHACHPEILHLTISVWLDRNIFFPGDCMLLRMKINNETNAMTRNMRISLMHVARYKGATTETDSVGAPNVVCKKQITAFPAYYFGVKWIPFTIPATLPLLSSSRGAITSCFFIQIDDFNIARQLTIPITILAHQTLRSLHPVPPEGILPPSAQIRPPLQPDEESTKCNLCEAPFGMLTFISHCRHCGKTFCSTCVNSTLAVPKLGLYDPVKVCRTCKRVIEETGGLAYELPKQVLAEWALNRAERTKGKEKETEKEGILEEREIPWVPKSKKEFQWEEVPAYDPFTVCYQAVIPPQKSPKNFIPS